MQRQLQLRIEAQGKYLKKIIEEQQRLGGVLTEGPGSGASVPVSGDNCLESDNKTDPATPAPTSEGPLLDKAAKETAPAKSLSLDESFSSHHEPQTPDSGCHVNSPGESSQGERSVKKQRVGIGAAYSKQEMLLTHHILESSNLTSSFHQQPHSVFLNTHQFDPQAGISISNEDQLDKVPSSNH